MGVTRRAFVGTGVGMAAAAAAAGSWRRAAGEPVGGPGIKAVAFDAFVIFDPRSVGAAAEAMAPGRGAELMAEWRTRQFEYSWLRVAAGKYVDFDEVTRDALRFACRKLGVELGGERQAELAGEYRKLKAWPDVPGAIESLRKAGYRLALLSNFTPAMLNGCVASAGLEGKFERLLSTDEVRTFKPDPRAYQLGMNGLKLTREEMAFVAFAGWDAAGAKHFGYRTLWANRMKAPAEELGARADGVGETLGEVVGELV